MQPDSNPRHVKRRPDPLRDLVRDLAREAARKGTYRGGFGQRLRTAQRLMARAAAVLDTWGRKPRRPAGQPELPMEG